ncbi:MAG TPA: sodium:solute symporter family protein [Clostridia bacterium]|nr:sodium:solute symporter family protein [Clostridia bacterium]
MYVTSIILIYLAITAFLGYLGYKRTKTSTDYLIAGRRTHPLIMALSYGATFISTSAIVGFGGAAGQLGMGLLWLTVLNIFVGIFIAFVIFGKRTRKMGHNLDAHTFPELLGLRYNSKFIQGFAGAIIFLFMPIYAASVIKGGADFIQSYFGISYQVSLLAFVAVVAVYVFMGGIKGVMYTDAFQGFLMFVGMTFLVVFTYSKLGGIASAHQQLANLYNDPAVKEQATALAKGGFTGWTTMPRLGTPIWWNLVSTIVMGVGIGVLAQPQLAVRFMTVKSNKELNRAVVSGGVFILMMTGVAFVVGALSNVYFYGTTGKIALAAAGANDKIIPEFIKAFVPEWFGPVFLITLLAAAMSTLSSQFHTMGSAIGRDVYEKSMGGKGGSMRLSKGGMLIGVLLSTALAWLTTYLDVSMAIIATGTSLFFGLCAASFLPSYIGALYIRRMPKAAAKWGMISGFVTSFIWIFFIHEKESASLQLCKLLTGKTSLLKDTVLSQLSMVDPIFIALPVSLIVTCILAIALKPDLEIGHLEKCFSGIGVQKALEQDTANVNEEG